MTEFFDLGHHCSVETCRQKDFLAVTCSHCNKHYCSSHRECSSHHCTYSIDEELKKSEIPQCPLCGELVSKRFPTEDNNLVISRHIENGCHKHNHSMNCAFHNCKEDQMVDCKHCGKSFCSEHRHQEDHFCKAVQNKTVTTTPFSKTNQFLKTLHENKVKRTNQTVETKAKFIIPLKNKTLDDSDAVKVTTYLKLDRESSGVPMKLSRLWSIGKALDILTDYGKIKNINNKLSPDSKDRLVLYKLSSNKLVPLSISHKVEEALSNGDVLILETVQTVNTLHDNATILKKIVPVATCSTEEPSFLEKLQKNYKQIFSH